MSTPTEQHDVEREHPAPCNWDGGADCTCPPSVAAEILDSDAPDNGGWDKERHCATDLRGADWAGRKLREAQEQIDLNAGMAEAELAILARKVRLVRERQDKADAPFRSTVGFMENALRVFAETHRDEVLKGLRKKSRLLPCGVTIGWRAQKGDYRYDQRPGPDGRPPTPAQNRAALVAWAEGEQASRDEDLIPLVNPGPAVPDLEEIKRHAASIRITGVCDVFVPPGLEYVPAGEVLTVSVGEEEESK
jgi:hypothetical protein